MSLGKIKHAPKFESQNEHAFKVVGSCVRAKDGRLRCDFQPVESDDEGIQFAQEVDVDVISEGNAESVESGDDSISNNRDIDSESHEDREVEV